MWPHFQERVSRDHFRAPIFIGYSSRSYLGAGFEGAPLGRLESFEKRARIITIFMTNLFRNPNWIKI